MSREKLHGVGLFHKLVPAAPGYERLRLKGLCPTKTYHVKARAQSLRVGQFGGLVKHIAPVDLNPNGAAIRLADHHYMLPDGAQELTASGGALMSGVMLENRFTGTGYDPNMRQQGDFGSNVYIVREQCSPDRKM